MIKNAILAAHGFSTRFSKTWLGFAAWTPLALHIYDFWCPALHATHGIAIHYSKMWPGLADRLLTTSTILAS